MAQDRSGPARPSPKKGDDGAACLRKFLKKQKLSYSDFGEKVGCTKAHVCGLVTRKSKPSGELAARMDAFSKGLIPQGSWFAAAAAAPPRR